MFYCLTNNSSFSYINTKLYIFLFLLDNIVKGDIQVSNLPDHLLDQQPTILELTTYAETAKWNNLGVKLGLSDVTLAGCHDCTSMYQLWIEEKAQNATKKNLLNALRSINQNNVARKYEEYLEKTVSYIVHISIYT